MEKEEAMKANSEAKPIPTPSLVSNTPSVPNTGLTNSGINSTPVNQAVPSTPSVPTRPCKTKCTNNK